MGKSDLKAAKDELCLAIEEWKRLQIRQKIKTDGRHHIWQGALAHGLTNSYGRFKSGGKSFLVHRAVLIWDQGKPPTPDSVARHLCSRKLCINPKHLRWGSHADNGKDYALHRKNGNRIIGKREALVDCVVRKVQGLLR